MKMKFDRQWAKDEGEEDSAFVHYYHRKHTKAPNSPYKLRIGFVEDPPQKLQEMLREVIGNSKYKVSQLKVVDPEQRDDFIQKSRGLLVYYDQQLKETPTKGVPSWWGGPELTWRQRLGNIGHGYSFKSNKVMRKLSAQDSTETVLEGIEARINTMKDTAMELENIKKSHCGHAGYQHNPVMLRLEKTITNLQVYIDQLRELQEETSDMIDYNNINDITSKVNNLLATFWNEITTDPKGLAEDFLTCIEKLREETNREINFTSRLVKGGQITVYLDRERHEKHTKLVVDLVNDINKTVETYNNNTETDKVSKCNTLQSDILLDGYVSMTWQGGSGDDYIPTFSNEGKLIRQEHLDSSGFVIKLRQGITNSHEITTKQGTELADIQTPKNFANIEESLNIEIDPNKVESLYDEKKNELQELNEEAKKCLESTNEAENDPTIEDKNISTLKEN